MKTKTKYACAFTLVLSFLITIGVSGGEASNGIKTYTYEKALDIILSNLTDVKLIDESMKQSSNQKNVTQTQINGLSRRLEAAAGYEEAAASIEDVINQLETEIEYLKTSGTAYPESPAYYQGYISQLEEYKNNLRKQLDGLNFVRDSEESNTAARTALQNSVDSLSVQMKAMELSKEELIKSAELNFREILINILNLESDVELTAESISLKEEELRLAQIKNSYGMLSDDGLEAVEYALFQNRGELEMLSLGLKSERQALNRLLRLPLTQRTEIEFTVKPRAAKALTGKNIEESPSVLQKQIDMDLSMLDLQSKESVMKSKENALYEWRSNTESQNSFSGEQLKWDYDQARLDYENAKQAVDASERELQDARRDAELEINRQLNTLSELEIKKKSLTESAEATEKRYEAALLSFKTGYATQYGASEAMLAVKKAKAELEKTVREQWKNSGY